MKHQKKKLRRENIGENIDLKIIENKFLKDLNTKF
jgi:hypothetical protein